MTALLLSLGSAASWGAADFLGGLASRRADPLPIALISQAVGFVVLSLAMIVLPGALTGEAVVWGALSGIAGAGGLVVYFRALSSGQMGAAAPLASLVGAIIPVGVGLGLGERPGQLAIVGVAVGVAATVLVSRSGEEVRTPRSGLVAAAVAGMLFGLFFVTLDQAPDDSGLWPLVAARVSGPLMLMAVIAVRRPKWPDRIDTRTALVSGVLDMTANVLFLLATRVGLLVLASVVSGLYPVAVVILAWLVLKERLARVQQVGVVMALAATALIAV